jgi:hypothetical protein
MNGKGQTSYLNLRDAVIASAKQKRFKTVRRTKRAERWKELLTLR